MKASEAVKQLQKLIEKYGDKDISYLNDGYLCEIYSDSKIIPVYSDKECDEFDLKPNRKDVNMFVLNVVL